MAGPATALPRFVEGVRVTATQLNALSTLLANLYRRVLGESSNRRPACAVSIAGTVTVPSGALTVLGWDVEDRDDADMFDPGDSALVAPLDGWYRVGMSATVAVASAAAGATLTGYVIPTTLAVVDARAAHTNRITAPRGHVTVSGVLPLPAGTPIRFAVQHTAGVGGVTSPLYGGCRAWAYWVAPLGDTDLDDVAPATPDDGTALGLGLDPLGTSPLGVGGGSPPGGSSSSGFGSTPFGTGPFGG